VAFGNCYDKENEEAKANEEVKEAPPDEETLHMLKQSRRIATRVARNLTQEQHQLLASKDKQQCQ